MCTYNLVHYSPLRPLHTPFLYGRHSRVVVQWSSMIFLPIMFVYLPVCSCITVDTRCVILDMAIAENMCDVRGRGTDVGDSKKAIMYRTPRVRLELFESVGLQYSTLCAHSFPKPHSSTQEDSYSSLRRTNTMQSLNSSPMPPTLLHQDHLLNTLEPGQVRNVIRFVNYRDILLFPLEQDSGDTSFVPSK